MSQYMVYLISNWCIIWFMLDIQKWPKNLTVTENVWSGFSFYGLWAVCGKTGTSPVMMPFCCTTGVCNTRKTLEKQFFGIFSHRNLVDIITNLLSSRSHKNFAIFDWYMDGMWPVTWQCMYNNFLLSINSKGGINEFGEF